MHNTASEQSRLLPPICRHVGQNICTGTTALEVAGRACTEPPSWLEFRTDELILLVRLTDLREPMNCSGPRHTDGKFRSPGLTWAE